MDLIFDSYLKRAENELVLANLNFNISISSELKRKLNLEEKRTFFNDVISQAYYCIFYTAKATLLWRGIETKVPEEHKKTYEKFKQIVNSGFLNRELLDIYETETVKAESLLKIFFLEKRKRSQFTYNIQSEANIPYAKESLENAKKFFSIINSLIKNKK